MRDRSPAVTAHYQARKGRLARLLIWIAAKDRSTGETETLGLWTGDDHATFSIGGEDRLYYGAGPIIEIDPLQVQTGLRVRAQRITLSGVDPAVQSAILQYEPRLAPVEMHIADFDPLTGALLAEPERRFKGIINGTPITTPEEGGDARIVVELLSAAARLRIPSAIKKSDESLQARAPGDRLRRHTDVTGLVDCYWGEARAAAPGPTTTEPAAPQTPEGPDYLREGGR